MRVRHCFQTPSVKQVFKAARGVVVQLLLLLLPLPLSGLEERLIYIHCKKVPQGSCQSVFVIEISLMKTSMSPFLTSIFKV